MSEFPGMTRKQIEDLLLERNTEREKMLNVLERAVSLQDQYWEKDAYAILSRAGRVA